MHEHAHAWRLHVAELKRSEFPAESMLQMPFEAHASEHEYKVCTHVC